MKTTTFKMTKSRPALSGKIIGISDSGVVERIPTVEEVKSYSIAGNKILTSIEEKNGKIIARNFTCLRENCGCSGGWREEFDY